MTAKIHDQISVHVGQQATIPRVRIISIRQQLHKAILTYGQICRNYIHSYSSITATPLLYEARKILSWWYFIHIVQEVSTTTCCGVRNPHTEPTSNAKNLGLLIGGNRSS